MKWTLCLLLTVALFVAARAAMNENSNSTDLDIVAADGTKLKATYYSPGKPGPGMLLLHQCNMDRKSWKNLATLLAQRGIHVLTFDYRGYGESPAPSGRQNLAPDIDAALANLAAQPGVDKNRLAAGGASCGVNNAVQLARRSGKIKALLLLSGPTAQDGLTYLRENPNTPIFAAASSEEGLAVTSLNAVAGTSKNSATTMQVLQNAGHGVPMFDANPTLLLAVADWTARVLHRVY